jgi:hypothetical protein
MQKKWFTFSIIIALVLTLNSSLMAAQEGRGLRMFDQTIKKACGTNAFEVARMYTQAEWKAIYEADALDAEFQKICPEAKPFKAMYKPDVYAFMYAAAKDSGKVLGAC